MIPSTELRLQTMIRALTESIIPAIAPGESLAQEQAGLLLGHINALLQQQGKEHLIDRDGMAAIRDLANFLLTVAEGGNKLERAKLGLNQALEGEDIEAISMATERLISAPDASAAFKRSAWKPTLEYSKKAAASGQKWFAPMRF